MGEDIVVDHCRSLFAQSKPAWPSFERGIPREVIAGDHRQRVSHCIYGSAIVARAIRDKPVAGYQRFRIVFAIKRSGITEAHSPILYKDITDYPGRRIDSALNGA